MSLVYIAGKMRGLPEFGFPAFHQAAAELRSLGHTVFNPAERDEKQGFDPAGLTGHEDLTVLGFSLRKALGADLDWVCRFAEVVALLPGWQSSKGARAEVAVAETLGLDVWTHVNGVGWTGRTSGGMYDVGWETAGHGEGMARVVVRGPWERAS